MVEGRVVVGCWGLGLVGGKEEKKGLLVFFEGGK